MALLLSASRFATSLMMMRCAPAVVNGLEASARGGASVTSGGGYKAPRPHRFSTTINHNNISSGNPTGLPGFVFDIDGVLVQGPRVLDAARHAIRRLLNDGGKVWKYPVCFLTNGGGVTEADKAAELSEWLGGAPVRGDQVVLSHTPLRALAPRFQGRPVLVCGRKESPAVALDYGFNQVLTTYDLADALPGALPFGRAALPPSWAEQRAAVFGGRCPVRDLGWGTPAAPIAAVLVLADPCGDAWYQDLQLALDVVTSHGVVLEAAPGTGERSSSGSGGSSSNSSSNGSGLPPPGSAPVPVYFSNPDVLWANECPRPRLGQGAFAAALGALHREVTGGPLPRAHFYGKPHAPQYRLAERLLLRQAAAATTTSGSDVAHDEGDDDEAALRARVKSTFSAIWAVGDNPAADVRGANTAGAPWVSVLVRTGVFQGGANSRSDPAALVVDDVDAAVTAALHRSREAKWHSMR